jgi:spermidine/putrescine transport system substrate-binding protein
MKILFLLQNLRLWFGKLFIVLLNLCIFFLFLYSPIFFDSFVRSDDSKELTIYSFTEFFPQDLIEIFEKKTGVKVNLRYFDTNEELFAKFRISRGEGYDIITPSDYAVKPLAEAGLLREIDKDSLSNLSSIDKNFLNLSYDRENRYSIPFAWSSYGIIYNRTLFDRSEVSYELIFNSEKARERGLKICMLDDPLEVISLASVYLFGRSIWRNESELRQIELLLLRQKNFVEAYNVSMVEYFLSSGIVQLAVVPSVVAKKIIEYDDRFAFKVPATGSLISIENLAIPISSKKYRLALEFIDFVLSAEVASYSSFHIGFNPVNRSTYNLDGVRFLKEHGMFPSEDLFVKLKMIDSAVSLDAVGELWLRVCQGS